MSIPGKSLSFLLTAADGRGRFLDRGGGRLEASFPSIVSAVTSISGGKFSVFCAHIGLSGIVLEDFSSTFTF